MIVFLKNRLVRRERKLARAHQASGRWQDALRHWKRVSRLQPENPNALLQIGNMFGELLAYEGALSAFEGAIALGASVDGLRGQAGVHIRQADWGKALHLLEKALAAAAGSTSDGPMTPALRSIMAGLLVQAASCSFFLGNTAVAERDLGIASLLSPSARWEDDAVVLRARLAVKNDEHYAFRILKRGLQNSPAHPGILYELTKIAAHIGEIDMARELSSRLGRLENHKNEALSLNEALGLWTHPVEAGVGPQNQTLANLELRNIL